MVVAEGQILGQVRDAIEQAQRLGTAGTHLGAAFRAAIACGKRVRGETMIGRADISAGSVLIDLLARTLTDWPAQRVLLIGAGRMNAVTAARLQTLGAGAITVSSRTPAAAQALAEAVRATVAPLEDLALIARTATVIVSATRSPGLMLTAAMLAGRAPGPLLVADLAVPRDVDPAVGDLPGVRLVDIDDLRDVQERQGMAEALAAAREMVEEAVSGWQTWCRTREAVPLIADLRAHVDRQKEAELARTLAQLDHLPEEERAAIAEMAHRLVNKMFHHLATRMKQAAADPAMGERYLEVARYLFARDEAPTEHGGPGTPEADRALPVAAQSGAE
jgi:glutamyl-tRNA reductase